MADSVNFFVGLECPQGVAAQTLVESLRRMRRSGRDRAAAHRVPDRRSGRSCPPAFENAPPGDGRTIGVDSGGVV